MKVSVLIPYRYDSDERHIAYHWIRRRYTRMRPFYEICIGTNDAEPMNRAAARNDAFKKATGDILIINDADTFCDQRALDLAVEMVYEDQRTWVVPFDVYYNLSEAFTEELLNGPEIHTPNPTEAQYDHRITHVQHPPEGSVAGVLVVPRAAYEATGGYDERFKAWGYEDDAQAWKWDHQWYPHKRLPGSCYHLWHPPAVDGDFNNPHIDENRQLFKEIKKG